MHRDHRLRRRGAARAAAAALARLGDDSPERGGRMKKTWIFAIVAALAALPLAAAEYPAKPLRLIVPFAPGGGNDVLARLIATELGAGFSQQTFVENRPGAAGVTATESVAKA